MSDEDLYKRAQKKVDEKIKFYRHLFSYVSVNIILFIVNMVCTPNDWWVQWVILFWGLGVLTHFIKTFILYEKIDDKYRDNMIEKEINKMRK